MPIPLRSDFDASQLRALARKTKNAPQARRLLALAAIYEGASRTEAARIGGVTLQIVRDWVLKFNAQGGRAHRPQAAGPALPAHGGAPGCARGHHRERSHSGRAWGGALAAR